MKNAFLIIVIFLFTSLPLFAQKDSSGVAVHKDPRIDLLVRKHIEINELNTRDARRFVQGYRILVMNTNDRTKANEAKAKIYQELPDMKVYLHWQQPFFKLKVGNFQTREEAEEHLDKVKRIFNQEVYIIRDVIEVNPDRSSEIQ
jgi:hypothetical protein